MLMKKMFTIASLFVAAVAMPALAHTTGEANGQVKTAVVSADPKDSYAEIKFDSIRHNFGTFSESSPIVKCSFTFTNTGTAPLVIHQAFASCGCTVPSYPKTPIKPGEKSKIDVTYNGTGKFPGHFQKTITIRSNSKTEVVRLIIEGTMTEK